MKLAPLKLIATGVTLRIKLKNENAAFLARYDGYEPGWLNYTRDGWPLTSPIMIIESVEVADVDLEIEKTIRASPVGVLP